MALFQIAAGRENHILLGFHIALNIFQCLTLYNYVKKAHVNTVKFHIKMDKKKGTLTVKMYCSIIEVL